MIFQLAFSTGSINGLIVSLQQYGFVDLIIPFILIFSVLFAILQKVGLFEKGEGKKYNTIISIAIALLIVIPHALSPNPNDVVSIMNAFLPQFVFITIALLILLILVGLVGGGMDVPSGGILIGIAAIIAVIYLALVIISSLSPTNGLPTFLNDPNFQAIVIVILVLGLVIWYISKTDEPNKPGLGETIKTLFGGGGNKKD